MMNRVVAVPLFGIALCSLLVATTAEAHWCSNIFVTQARLVVKPEKSTVYVGSSPAQLRVYLQNNFPYRLFNVRMQASASGYDISVVPSSDPGGGHDPYPGQNVSYLFTITRTSGSAGDMSVSTMNLQVDFRLGNWRDLSDDLVYYDQVPSESSLISQVGHDQSGSLSAGGLAEFHPYATLSGGSPYFGRTGMQQLIHWFGYRFCYNSGGSYRCGNDNCPNPCSDIDNQYFDDWSSIEQFPQNVMRAGAELGARKSKLGSDMQAARDAAVNALTHSTNEGNGGGSNEHKCLAAIVGGYLWQGVSAPNAFTDALQLSANQVPAICQDAGLRAHSSGSALSCGGGQYYERAACAAAEGLRNNDGPVTSILMPNAGDGDSNGSYTSLYYAYMLYIVQAYRNDTTGTVPFYPDAGGPTADSSQPVADSTVDSTVDSSQPTSDSTVDSFQPTWDSTVDSFQPAWDSTVDSSQPTSDSTVDSSQPTSDTQDPGDMYFPQGDTYQPPWDMYQAGDTSPYYDVYSGGEGSVGGEPVLHGEARVLEGGCGCEVHRQPVDGPGIALLGILLLLVVFRGRRQRRR